jgi:hypothetical protein
MYVQRWSGKLSLKIATSVPFLAFAPTLKSVSNQWMPNKLSDGTTPIEDHLELVHTDENATVDLFPNLLTVGGGSSRLTILISFVGTIEYFKEKG